MEIRTDIHSHILPQIDDGAEDIEISLSILRGLQSLGYTKVWTTPHISYLYPNDLTTIRDAFEYVKEAAIKDNLSIELNYAAEYMFDDNFVKNIYSRDNLLTLPNKHLLIEFQMHNDPVIFYKDVLFNLQIRGYKLILAHPERYMWLFNSFSRYEELKQLGMEFQVNLLSFSGYYGKPVRKMAEKLLKKGMIDFLGTDIHHPDQIELLRDKKIAKAFSNVSLKNNLF